MRSHTDTTLRVYKNQSSEGSIGSQCRGFKILKGSNPEVLRHPEFASPIPEVIPEVCNCPQRGHTNKRHTVR